jgi:hypothetical protein
VSKIYGNKGARPSPGLEREEEEGGRGGGRKKKRNL